MSALPTWLEQHPPALILVSLVEFPRPGRNFCAPHHPPQPHSPLHMFNRMFWGIVLSVANDSSFRKGWFRQIMTTF
jgi:hypothetical protein